MTECTVAHLVEAALANTRLHACHQIAPEGNLRAVERGLLDDAFGTIGDIGEDDLVGLIGSITEEIALEYGLCSLQRALNQLVVGIEHGLQLLGVRESPAIHMDHRVILPDLGAIVETEDVGRGILKCYM